MSDDIKDEKSLITVVAEMLQNCHAVGPQATSMSMVREGLPMDIFLIGFARVNATSTENEEKLFELNTAVKDRFSEIFQEIWDNFQKQLDEVYYKKQDDEMIKNVLIYPKWRLMP